MISDSEERLLGYAIYTLLALAAVGLVALVTAVLYGLYLLAHHVAWVH